MNARASTDEALPTADATGRHRVTWFKRYLWLHYNAFSGGTHFIGRRVTRVGWFVAGGLGGLCLMSMDPRMTLAYKGLFFLSFLILASPFLAQASRSRFEVERRMPRFGSVDCELIYTVRVRNVTRRFQRGVAVIENLPDPRPSVREFSITPEPGEEKRNWWDRRYLFYRWKWLIDQRVHGRPEESDCPDIEPGGVVDVPMKLTPIRRGPMRFESIAIGCPDPIGLYRAMVRASSHHDLLILPKRYPVGRLELPGKQSYQQGGVALASQIGESEEFISLRDYRAGDPLKKIHWPSWARTGRPIVKEFVDEFFVRHGLILDTFTNNPYSREFEEAVSVAASFACTIEEQDSLLDLMVIGPQAFTYTVGRGVGSLEKMLEVLAGVHACQDKPFSVLENLVIAHGRELSGCVCVLLSWDEERQHFVRRLRRMQIPVKVVLIRDPNEKAIPEPGVMMDDADNFHVIASDQVAEGLKAL